MSSHRFSVQRLLGRGGMGEVYFAIDEKLNRPVALKTIPSADPKFNEALTREAQALASISHPSIAQIHDVLEEDGATVLVLEYVAGTSLADVMRASPVSLDDALKIARDVADGLAGAHASGVAHCDLKPENIMVLPDGRAKILDFGLAAAIQNEDAYSSSSGLAGTLDALSPEQVGNGPIDIRTDLFSFGTLLYELFTGVHPFVGDLPVETMHRIVHHKPNPPRTVSPVIPVEVSGLIAELIQKDPTRRPSARTAVDLLQRAKNLLEMEGTDARRALKRRRKLRVGAMILGTSAAIVFGVAWFVFQSAPPPPPLSVAVLAPTVSGEAPGDRLDLVASAIRLASMNALAERQNLFVINTGEVDAIEGTPGEIARAVAADEVITLAVNGLGATSAVEVARLSGASASVIWTGRMEVPNDDLWLVADTVRAHLVRGFPDRPMKPGTFEVQASAEAYEEYLALRQRALAPGAHAQMKEHFDALTAIRKRAPKLLDVYVLETSYARYIYESTNDRRYLERALSTIQAAKRIAPDDQRTRFASAEIAILDPSPDEAEVAINSLLDLDPTNPGVIRQKARFLELHNRKREALELLSDVCTRRPSWRNLVNLSRLEADLGFVAQARKHLEMAVERAPNSSVVKINAARFEMNHGDLGKAEELFFDTISKDPNPQYLTMLGTCQILLQEYDRAVTSFERAADLGSRSNVLRLNHGEALKFSGRRDEAEALFSRAIASIEKKDSRSESDLRVLIQALAHNGRYEEAHALIHANFDESETNPRTLFAIAVVEALSGESDAADSSITKAIDHGLSPVWLTLPFFGEETRGRVEQPSSTRPESL